MLSGDAGYQQNLVCINLVARQMKSIITTIILAVALAIPAAAYAHEFTLGDLLVEHPWARASIGPARSGAIYVTLTNNGALPDRLLGASTPVATRARIHMHMMQDNVRAPLKILLFRASSI